MPRYPTIGVVYHPTEGGIPIDKTVGQQVFDSALRYEADDDDLFVVTYPKNGTTWMMYILHMLRGNDGELADQTIFKCYASLDFQGGVVTNNFPRPRLIKTHLRYSMVPRNENTKYIFMARNPKDTVVSHFYHTKGFTQIYDFADGKFDDFFDFFMRGDCDFGDYFQMVPEWWKRSQTDENIHFILYEDLKTNFRSEVLKLARFLGEDNEAKLLENDEKLLKYIEEKSSITSMKSRYNSFTPNNRSKEHEQFTRKGIIGDWKNHFSNEQNEQVNDKMQRTAIDYPGFDQLWRNYDV